MKKSLYMRIIPRYAVSNLFISDLATIATVHRAQWTDYPLIRM